MPTVKHRFDLTGRVALVDLAQMCGVIGDNTELRAVAVEAGERLRRKVAALGESLCSKETLQRHVRRQPTRRRWAWHPLV